MFKIRFNKKIAFSNNSNLRFSVVRRRFFIFSNHKKGVVLLIVLGTLLVVTSLATVILSLILSHARLTYHQTNRIQAYYVAMAGVNYALEKLRTGDWRYNLTPYENTCPNPVSGYPTCTVPETGPDPSFPQSIVNQRAYIVFCTPGTTCYGIFTPCGPPSGTNFCVNSTAIYTYTNP